MSRKVKSEEIEEPTLSVQQEQVILFLLAGKSQRTAAEEAGIDEATLSRWKRSDPAFVAAWNAARRDHWDFCVDRVRTLTARALDVFEESLDSENESTRLKAACAILRRTSVEILNPTGETTPENVANAWAKDRELRRLLSSW